MRMTPDANRTLAKGFRLGQLRAFCHAVRLGSMGEAARHLGTSYHAVTRHVLDLEYELGEALFGRGGAGVTITAAGETFDAHAAPVV